ncbi:MAG: type II toxin-antitoxin system HigB family toxin [Patescibacteria group bacterium]|nr:type II toxin-antitoxin system HigB family toxin [Patescibacteria group bacterium]
MMVTTLGVIKLINTMELIGKKILSDFKRRYNDVSSQVDSWQAEVEAADWETPHDVKRRYASASFPGRGQAIFNLKGNQYRLLVIINFKNKIILIKKAGTHQEYMNWQLT